MPTLELRGLMRYLLIVAMLLGPVTLVACGPSLNHAQKDDKGNWTLTVQPGEEFSYKDKITPSTTFSITKGDVGQPLLHTTAPGLSFELDRNYFDGKHYSLYDSVGFLFEVEILDDGTYRITTPGSASLNGS